MQLISCFPFPSCSGLFPPRGSGKSISRLATFESAKPCPFLFESPSEVLLCIFFQLVHLEPLPSRTLELRFRREAFFFEYPLPQAS